MDIFEEVKKLDNHSVALFYLGKPSKRSGGYLFYKSPFRQEKTPSFAVNEKRFWDFGDAWRGDSVDLVCRLFGLRPRESARLIASDFGIQVEEKWFPPKERIAYIQQKDQKAELHDWWVRTFDTIKIIMRNIRAILKTYGPFEQDELFFFLVELLAECEVWLDILVGNDQEEVTNLRKRIGGCFT